MQDAQIMYVRQYRYTVYKFKFEFERLSIIFCQHVLHFFVGGAQEEVFKYVIFQQQNAPLYLPTETERA